LRQGIRHCREFRPKVRLENDGRLFGEFVRCGQFQLRGNEGPGPWSFGFGVYALFGFGVYALPLGNGLSSLWRRRRGPAEVNGFREVQAKGFDPIPGPVHVVLVQPGEIAGYKLKQSDYRKVDGHRT
jgi:hypothetical protein